jgi:hypothetical protein
MKPFETSPSAAPIKYEKLRCAVRFEPMCAKSGFFNTSSKVLPCGLFVSK